MIQVQPEVVKDLEYILKEEISVYRSLLLLETNKKESIVKSKGKELESATKQISHLLTIATEVETRRLQALNKMFADKNLKPQGKQVVMTEFLESVEPNLKDRFSQLADDLKKVGSCRSGFIQSTKRNFWWKRHSVENAIHEWNN